MSAPIRTKEPKRSVAEPVTRATPSSLRALSRRDPRLGAAMQKLPRFPAFPDPANKEKTTHWDELSRAIVFQQLAGAAARTIHGRVCALTPSKQFPDPAQLLAFDEPTLRSAGLSRNKIAALRDLALHVQDERLDLARLDHLADEEIEAQLVAVRGIGQWSAHMFLLFRLGRLDVGAAGDLGVREGLRLLDGLAERPTPKAALARMEAWRPLRSVGCWMMWRVVEAERERAKSAQPGASKRARVGSPQRTRAPSTRKKSAPSARTPTARAKRTKVEGARKNVGARG